MSQVGEDDYHQLKHDQRLRVDFKSFPRQFIELLESCATADPESFSEQASVIGGGLRFGQNQGVFLARLETTSSPVGSSSTNSYPGHSISSHCSQSQAAAAAAASACSTFSLVETNYFKELTHLSLKLRAGNDAAVKAYLAARLRQLRGERAALSSQLTETADALARERETACAAAAEVEQLRTGRERDLRDLRYVA